MLLDYRSTLVAKEYVVYNNPRAEPTEIGEELVRSSSGCVATSPSVPLDPSVRSPRPHRPRSRPSGSMPRPTSGAGTATAQSPTSLGTSSKVCQTMR